MHAYRWLITGLLMTSLGGYLIFAVPQALPLWLVWLAGPFFWYVGIGVSITAIALPLFVPAMAREQMKPAMRNKQVELPLLRFGALAYAKAGPAGVRCEIPAMGGFIL